MWWTLGGSYGFFQPNTEFLFPAATKTTNRIHLQLFLPHATKFLLESLKNCGPIYLIGKRMSPGNLLGPNSQVKQDLGHFTRANSLSELSGQLFLLLAQIW